MSYDINKLKLTLGVQIVENNKLQKDQKLALIEFVKNANDLQIKHLSLTGEVKYKFNTKESQLTELNFKNSKSISTYEDVITEGTTKSVLGILFWGAGAWAVWRLIRAAVDKERRKCGIFTIGEKRDKCLQKVEIIEQQKKIDAIQKALPKCSGSADPQRCKQAGQAALTKTKMDLQKAQQRYKESWGK